jgi:type I restriction enzyme R subunit
LDDTETEADACRRLVTPRLQAAGWDKEPYALQEQRIITPGRILFSRGGTGRGARQRLDYRLRYRLDLPLAMVEAKASYRSASDGMQQELPPPTPGRDVPVFVDPLCVSGAARGFA